MDADQLGQDRCAVLLLGSKLAMATRDPDWLALFSPATRAQLDLSNQIAAQIKNQGLDDVRAVVSLCLGRDPHWVERSRRAVAEVRYAGASVVRPEAIAVHAAFDLAATGQTNAAAARIQTAINGLEDPALRGVLRDHKAAYLHFTDPQLAQQLQSAAV